jgi:alanine-glyoxylate transaminase/serine-glyoxylate transaminase/serine-pyruvate transaminase
MSYPSGRHFLQIPGPTNVPEQVLRAMAKPTIDHRGPEFKALGLEVLSGLKPIFKTESPVVIFASSGTGAWEAGLVNTLSHGDKVLMFETGHFATLWKNMAVRLGLEVDFVPGDWRHGADPSVVGAKLAEDRERRIKSVMVVHNETSTGVTSRIAEIRKAIDRSGHPALFMVDTISSLGSIDYRHDEWGVDVTVGCSQKGLMLPPGSSPATNLLYGLREALHLLAEEGLDNVFARHLRHAEATRRAVRTWGLDILCLEPTEYSPVLTTVVMPGDKGADAYRAAVLDKFNMSLGSGLGILKDRVFRIGHLGDFNDLSLIGTLGGVEMGFAVAGVPYKHGGVMAAMDYLAAC